jgi:integrase
MIAKFRTSLRSEVGTERINNCINLLRAVLEIAVRDGHIKENPAKGLGSLEPTEIKEEIDPLTREELDLILRVIPAKYRPIFICLAWTGARPGELKALRWSDVDWRAGEISISKTRYKGQEGTTKTKSGKRRVMMLPPVLEALKQLKAAQSVSELTGHVFVSKDGTLLDHLDRVWASALKKAGMRHRPSYQLRHTFASLCLSAGIEPGLIGRWLGHSGPQITLKHYARFIVDTKRDNQRFLNALFRSNEQDKSVSTDVSTVAMDVA